MTPFKKNTPKEQIGQLLIQRGKITPEQLEQALQLQKKERGFLGEILVKLGFVTEEDIVQILALQHDLPYLPLANYEIDFEVAKLIPESLASKYHVLAVDKMSDILTVVMANPLDEEAIKEIEALTKCKIEVFLGTSTEIKEAIERIYT